MTTWNPGDRALATVRGVADVEVVRTDDPDLPWHSDERVPDYFGPQTEHAERMVRDLRPLPKRLGWVVVDWQGGRPMSTPPDSPPEGWGSIARERGHTHGLSEVCRRGECPAWRSVQRAKKVELARTRWKRVKRRLPCLFRRHKWIGYGQQPLPFITCERCGFEP